MKQMSRREFCKKVSLVAGGMLAGANVFSGCVTPGKNINKIKIPEKLEDFEKKVQYILQNYDKITKNWDAIYGPPILRGYYGYNDFKGHIGGGVDGGVDYDVSKNTPLVPTAISSFNAILNTRIGGLVMGLRHLVNNPLNISCYGHLGDTVFGDEELYRNINNSNLIERNKIVALSGNSGLARKEDLGIQVPHLHYGLYLYSKKLDEGYHIDPEKYGLDGGKPVFWDCETDLSAKPPFRKHMLEILLYLFEKNLETWPKNKELQELKCNLLENYHLINYNNAKEILDSKHFHDMRSLLKKKTLEKKLYIPGTKPYSLMMKVVGYSTDEKQKLILTLPFIAPNLKHLYKVYSNK